MQITLYGQNRLYLEMFMYLHAHVTAITIVNKEATDLKESGKGYVGLFGGRKGKMMQIQYNLKNY